MGEYIASAVILMTFSMPLLAIWTRHRREVMRLQGDAGLARLAHHAADRADVEERLRVLERIVTDNGYALANRIEALREEPRRGDRLEARRIEESI
ncbi:MAG TPA: hypothetical protein VEB68_14530 [Croceibacterium sp.]|nr:hypothetical protein [Croceibacterium sp.]